MKIYTLPAQDLTAADQAHWSQVQAVNSTIANPSFCPEFTLAATEIHNDIEVAVLEFENAQRGYFPYQRTSGSTAIPVGYPLSEMNGLIAGSDATWNSVELLKACGLKRWKFDHLVADQTSFAPHFHVLDESPYIDVSDGFDAYLEFLGGHSKSVLRTWRKKAGKLEKQCGPLRFTLNDTSPQLFETLIDWKRAQIALQGYADIFQDPKVVDFLACITGTSTPDFSCMLSTLYAGDHLVALSVVMKCRDVASVWIPTFSYDHSKHSPGLLFHIELARTCAENGITRIDLGRGENRLKETLANSSQTVALGSVDASLWGRSLTSAWYGSRALAHSKMLRGKPLHSLRRVKKLLTTSPT